jgi:hypothetical protein
VADGTMLARKLDGVVPVVGETASQLPPLVVVALTV